MQPHLAIDMNKNAINRIIYAPFWISFRLHSLIT
jgi:hypothetical protein